MPTLSGKLIRLACNQSSASPTLDALTGLAPVIWQGAQANLQCALFTDDPASTTYVTDVSNIVSVNLLVRAVNERGTLLLTKTIVAGADIVASSYAAWIALTGQQFTFALSSVDTNQTVKSDGTLRLYFSISVTTASTTFVVGQGTAEIVDVGIVDVTDPVAPTFFPVVVDGNGLVQNVLPTDFTSGQLTIGGVAVTAGAGSGTVTSIGSFESGGIAVFDDTSGTVIRQGTAGEVFDFDDPVASFLPAYDFGTTSWAEIGVGTATQVLTSNGSGSLPSFQDNAVDLSNYLTLDGDGQNVIVNGNPLGDWLQGGLALIWPLFGGSSNPTFGDITVNTITGDGSALSNITVNIASVSGLGTGVSGFLAGITANLASSNSFQISRGTGQLIMTGGLGVAGLSVDGVTLGTAASQNTGTSGANVPLLSTANTWASGQVFVAPVLGTPASGTLTNATGLPVSGITASTSTALGVGSIELGHVSDTTLSRLGAGSLGVEGTAVLLNGGALGTPSSATGTNFTGIPESGVTNLTSDLALKAPLASPTFTGTVVLPSGQALIAPALGTIASGNGAALTSLTASNITGSTTVGRNILSLTNPSAISFVKIAADNTVSTRTPAQVLSDIGAAASGANTDITSIAPNTGVFSATTSLLLGTAGSAVGNIGFRNATSGTATLAPPTGALSTYTVTLPNAASTLPIFGQQITVSGPSAARTWTAPDASFTIARTDAANTFTGVQSMTSPSITTGINDANNNSMLAFTATTNAVNGWLVKNNASGGEIFLGFTGTDSTSARAMRITTDVAGGSAGAEIRFTNGLLEFGRSDRAFPVIFDVSTGPTIKLGATNNSSPAMGKDAVNGITFQSGAGTTTWNDASTANSGTVANRYLVGIAAPTLTSTGTSVTNTVASTVYIGGAPTDSTNTTSTTKYALNVAGNVKIGSAGTSVLNIRHGISGVMTLGAVTVTDTGCTANTRYFFSAHTLGTISIPGGYYTSTRNAGTSFVITSSQATETSTIDWMAIEP